MPVVILQLLSILFVIIFTACKQKPTAGPVVSRDTTITIANAYSQLFIDSNMVEQFITAEVKSDSIALYMRNLYNSRNYSSAWFDEHGLTLQAQGFWSTHKKTLRKSDSSIYDKQLHQVVDTLIEDSTYILSQDQLIETELKFTRHFFNYVQYAYEGKVDPNQVQWHIPRRKLQPLALLDSLLSDKNGQWKPLSNAFQQLQQKLYAYRDIRQNGGWITIDKTSRKLKAGSTDKIITQVKKRLQVTGDYDTDTLPLYNPAFTEAIKRVELRFGLRQNGVVDNDLINELNVSVEDRIKQMLVNLERMKWMPREPVKYLLANIPEYTLHIVETNKEVMNMSIVVGKSANRSVIFSDDLKYVVFSPYWNIPRSIVRNEIYPAMQRSSSYLNRKNMEVTGYSNGLPLVRQKPGQNNSLGKVKFIFPNSYNIYFHDTPAKSLFDKQDRAFSHGCIRLHRPFDLAEYVLADQPQWTGEKIKEAMNSSAEKWVTLKKTIPVFITYFTSWVDKNGLLHFAKDIYGHDADLAEHLFQQ